MRAVLVGAVLQQHVDRAVGEHRAQRERHVGGGDEFVDGGGDDAGHPASPELLGERDGGPSRSDEGVVRLFEARTVR